MEINILVEALIFKMPWVKRKFTVDNNFLFKYVNLSDKQKNKFIKLIKMGKLEFYFTDVLLGEILHLVDRDVNRLKIHSEIINKMNFKALFNNFIQFIAGEIKNCTFVEYCPETIEEEIRELFVDLTSSGHPSAQKKTKILKYLQENQNYEAIWKNDAEANIVNIRASLRRERTRSKIFIQNLKDFFKGGFSHYYNFKNEEKTNHVINFLKVNGVIVSREDVTNAVNNKKCLYLSSWLKCKFALHYKYIREDYNQLDVNDLRDIQYLYYLPKIDYLVSDDNRVSQLGKMIYKKNKVLTFDDFFRTI